MAEPGPASNDAPVPASSSSAAAPSDWEMLSMSMSASALGKPDAGRLDNVNPHPEKTHPQIESSFSQVNPHSFQENPDASFASDAWACSLPAGANRDGRVDIIAEPFTEGWKPHLSASSDLHAHGAERGYGEETQQEEALLSSQGTETYYDSNAFMVVPKGSFVPVKEEWSYAHSDDVEFERASPKTTCKRGKQPRMSSRVMWSIAVTATMVGIAILGHRWRLACHDNQQLRLELSAKDESLCLSGCIGVGLAVYSICGGVLGFLHHLWPGLMGRKSQSFERHCRWVSKVGCYENLQSLGLLGASCLFIFADEWSLTFGLSVLRTTSNSILLPAE